MDSFDRVLKDQTTRLFKTADGTAETNLPGTEHTFWIEGNPIPKKRPRFSKDKVYNPTFQRDQKDRMLLKMQCRHLKPLECPVFVHMEFHMPIPKSASKKVSKRLCDEFYVGSIDLDNLIKQYLDIMNKIVFNDDRQVVALSSKKFYSDTPGVRIRVIPYE